MDSIVNMTVQDFLDRTPDGDGFSITVKHHKTDKKDAVYIYISKSTYNLINTFYQGIRAEMNFPSRFFGQTLFCTVKGGLLRRCDDALKILNKFIKDNSKSFSKKKVLHFVTIIEKVHCLIYFRFGQFSTNTQ